MFEFFLNMTTRAIIAIITIAAAARSRSIAEGLDIFFNSAECFCVCPGEIVRLVVAFEYSSNVNKILCVPGESPVMVTGLTPLKSPSIKISAPGGLEITASDPEVSVAATNSALIADIRPDPTDTM